jgi:hypothetical protein
MYADYHIKTDSKGRNKMVVGASIKADRRIKKRSLFGSGFAMGHDSDLSEGYILMNSY